MEVAGGQPGSWGQNVRFCQVLSCLGNFIAFRSLGLRGSHLDLLNKFYFITLFQYVNYAAIRAAGLTLTPGAYTMLAAT